MKKMSVLWVLMAVLLVFSFQGLNAAEDGGLFLNVGLITDDSLSFKPLQWMAGLSIDFPFGSALCISPECYAVVNKLEFDTLALAPGIMLNLNLDSLFVGGGVTKWFNIGDVAMYNTDFMLKLNAGLKSKSLKLTAFAIMAFDNLFKNMSLGVTLGFIF